MLLNNERELIVKYCKMLVTHNLTRGTGGNISILNRELNLFAISPSGMDYFEMTAQDVPVIDLNDNKLNKIVEGKRKPSSEIDMHRLLYLSREDISAAVHTHSPFATALSCTQEALTQGLPPVHYLAALGGESIKCVKYAPFGSLELAELARDGMKNNKAVLLGNHGLLAAGNNIIEAFNIAEELEFCCEIYFRAKIFGTPKLLSQEDMNFALKKFKSYGQP